METMSKICHGSADDLFNIVVGVASTSEFIGGLRSARAKDGWRFTLERPLGKGERSRPSVSEVEQAAGDIQIRQIALEPPRTRLECVPRSEEAQLFVNELLSAIAKHPLGGEVSPEQ